MNRTTITTITLCTLLLASGCGDALDAPTVPEIASERDGPRWGDRQVTVIEQMAKSMAGVLADPEAREALYEEAAEEYTGDTEALYARIASKRVGGTTWADRLGVDAHPDDTKWVHFYVYGIEYSNPGEAPLVAVGTDDEDVPALKAFDSDGNEHQLDAQTPPGQTVVVVGLNERLDEHGRPRREFLDLDPLTYEAGDGPGSTGARGGGGGGGSFHDFRSAPHTEHIDSIYMIHDNENWFRGSPEIMMQMNVISSPTFPAWKGAFPEVDDERVWYDVDQRLFGWRRDPPDNDHGPMAAVMWWEEDGGDIKEIPVGAVYKGVSITFTFTLRSSDDQMGSAFVNFEDDLFTHYDTNEIEWKHK